MSENLILTEAKDKILKIILNDPKTRNAFSLDMAQELLKVVKQADKNPDIRCIILTGASPSFSAGGNIKLMAQTPRGKREKFFLDISKALHEVAMIFRQSHKIIIASINGPVSGVALGLALSSDLRLASSEATFNAGTTLIGLAPNGSSTYYLPRLIGMAKATEMLLTGKKVSAEEACSLGLINRVCTPDSLEKEAWDLATQISKGAPLAQAKIKQLLSTTWDKSLKNQLEDERQAIAWTSETDDFDEGIQAFLNKRSSQFQGK